MNVDGVNLSEYHLCLILTVTILELGAICPPYPPIL